jgi:hypothetical protein
LQVTDKRFHLQSKEKVLVFIFFSYLLIFTSKRLFGQFAQKLQHPTHTTILRGYWSLVLWVPLGICKCSKLIWGDNKVYYRPNYQKNFKFFAFFRLFSKVTLKESNNSLTIFYVRRPADLKIFIYHSVSFSKKIAEK